MYVIDGVQIVKKDHGGYRNTPAYYGHWKRVLTSEPLPRFDALTR